jgi:hypothetical protein
MDHERAGARVIFTRFISSGYLETNDAPIALRSEY